MAIILKKKNASDIPTPTTGKVTFFIGPDGNPRKKDEFGAVEGLFTLPVTSFTYTQPVPSNIWNVFHNLGDYPLVQVIDHDGNDVEAEIFHINANVTEIRFLVPIRGMARFVI
jgi:hypothetical protein